MGWVRIESMTSVGTPRQKSPGECDIFLASATFTRAFDWQTLCGHARKGCQFGFPMSCGSLAPGASRCVTGILGCAGVGATSNTVARGQVDKLLLEAIQAPAPRKRQ